MSRTYLFGKGASVGIISGPVRVIYTLDDILNVSTENILVAKDATPHLLPALIRSKGVVSERGGITCHLAILSREFGKPCVVGIDHVTEILKTGMFVQIDGTRGEIIILDQAHQPQ